MSTPVPGLDVVLDLDRPRLAGSAIVDESGVVTLTGRIPPGAGVRLIWIQAAEQGRVSNLIVDQIN